METETNGTNGTQKSTALTVVKPNQALGKLASAYEPRNASEAHQIAAWFAKSGLLGEITTPEKAFLIMATGADLGIPATTALRTISIVKGKPVLAADLMKAMCISRKDVCEHFKLVKSDDKIATYSAKRVGDDEPVVLSFTVEDAIRAKLAERGTDKSDNNYAKYPAVMLRRRCIAMLARELFPDVVLGVYCEEEADEIRGEQRIIDAEVVEAAAADDLAERIAGFLAQLDAAQTTDDLKAFRAAVSKDPAAAEVKDRVKDAYDAKAAEIKAKE